MTISFLLTSKTSARAGAAPSHAGGVSNEPQTSHLLYSEFLAAQAYTLILHFTSLPAISSHPTLPPPTSYQWSEAPNDKIIPHINLGCK
jgi:hypothetical protein